MTAAFAFRTMLELIAVLLLIYGLFHEKKLIRLEDRFLQYAARKLRARRRRVHAVSGASAVSEPVMAQPVRQEHAPRHNREPRRVA